MNIRVSGCMSLEDYGKVNDQFEEFRYAIESIEFHNYNINDCIGTEGIMSDMIKGSVKATTGAVKMGVKGVKTANKAWSSVKNRWAQIKPVIIKMIKDFGIALSNLYHKFMQYDKKYKELGQKINNIIQFSVNQMQYMPSVTIYYHMFNVEFLKGVIDVISNWAEFVSAVTVGYKGRKPGIFSGDVPAPETVADAIKKNDLNRLQSLVQDFSNGIGKLNQYGELTIAMVLDNVFRWGVTSNLPREIRDKASKNQVSLSEYIKYAILGEQIQKQYDNSNKQEFVRDMTGDSGSYLKIVSSILNNNILQDALQKGGVSTKKGTDNLVKLMEQVMKQAEVTEKINADKEAQRARQDQINSSKQAQSTNTSTTSGDDIKQATINFNNNSQNFGTTADTNNAMNPAGPGPGNTDNSTTENTISGLAELYCKNYVIFVTKLSNTYGNLVRGVLAATYEIISETDTIIKNIEAAANRTK